eukprot:2910295-Rhodomonas_salina.2
MARVAQVHTVRQRGQRACPSFVLSNKLSRAPPPPLPYRHRALRLRPNHPSPSSTTPMRHRITLTNSTMPPTRADATTYHSLPTLPA